MVLPVGLERAGTQGTVADGAPDRTIIALGTHIAVLTSRVVLAALVGREGEWTHGEDIEGTGAQREHLVLTATCTQGLR